MFGCSPLRVVAPQPCQKPVTGPPGSARALDAILIDGLGHGRRAAHAFPPQAVLASVPASLAAVGNSSPRTDINRRLLVPLFFKVHQRRFYPLTNKVMAGAFWSAFDQIFKENFSAKSPVFRAVAAPGGEKSFWEGRARHMPPVRSSH